MDRGLAIWITGAGSKGTLFRQVKDQDPHREGRSRKDWSGRPGYSQTSNRTGTESAPQKMSWRDACFLA